MEPEQGKQMYGLFNFKASSSAPVSDYQIVALPLKTKVATVTRIYLSNHPHVCI